MDRREFLQLASIFSLSFLLPGSRGWCFSDGKTENHNKRLIVILLRGAVDGLNVVAPYGDPIYYDLRPKIGIPAPGAVDGLLDLDGHFGLNPAAQALMPYWHDKKLAFVHASGSPDPSRSHFQAQDYMETGMPGQPTASTGWLNRLVAEVPAKQSGVRAVSIGPVLPRICSGSESFASLSNRIEPQKSLLDTPEIASVFEGLYCNKKDELGRAFSEGMAAHHEINDELIRAKADQEQIAANHGAPILRAGDPFGTKLAALLKKAPSIRVVFLDFGGWDTHVNQGTGVGNLARRISPLAGGLADLANGLGPLFKDSTIVIMSEFGRTAAQNVNNGTDHGHGNVMWLLGGDIAGGKVYGRWGGLSPNALYQARDLPTTTDFRSVLSRIISEQMGVSAAGVARIFPGFKGTLDPFVRT